VSGFLGFDPERVVVLRRALGEVDDELGALKAPDPLAGEAVGIARAALRRLVTTWRPRLTELLACDPTSAYQPVVLDPLDLSLVDVVRLDRVGWTTVTDPLEVMEVDPVDHAEHLAHLLLGLTAADVLGNARLLDDLTTAIGQLTPERALAFGAVLGPTTWGWWVAEAGTGAGGAALAAALGRAATPLLARGPRAWEEALLDAAPLAGARALAGIDLATDHLVRLAGTVWERSLADPFADALAARELLATTLARRDDGMAALALLEGWPDDRLDELIGPTAVPGPAAGAFLVAATRSGERDEDRFAQLTRVLAWLDERRELWNGTGLAPSLAEAAGLRLDWFAPEAGPRWAGLPIDWHGRDPLVILDGIAHEPAAARELERALAIIVPIRTRQIERGKPELADADLEALGRLVASVEASIAGHRVTVGERRYRTWTTGWHLAESALGLLLPRSGPVVPELGARTRRLVERGQSDLAPRSPEAVRADEHRRTDSHLAVHEHDVVQAVLDTVTGRPGTIVAPAPGGLGRLAYGELLASWVSAPGLSPAEAATRRRAWERVRAFDAAVARGAPG
jgi:hypothetical protein